MATTRTPTPTRYQVVTSLGPLTEEDFSSKDLAVVAAVDWVLHDLKRGLRCGEYGDNRKKYARRVVDLIMRDGFDQALSLYNDALGHVRIVQVGVTPETALEKRREEVRDRAALMLNQESYWA